MAFSERRYLNRNHSDYKEERKLKDWRGAVLLGTGAGRLLGRASIAGGLERGQKALSDGRREGSVRHRLGGR